MDKKDKLIANFRDLYSKMAYLNNIKMNDKFEDFTSTEVHCIEYIGQNDSPNVTKLAEAFYMTRGGVSKLTQKLMKKGAIECYQNAENKKEVYFRLTEKGKILHKTHENLHNEFAKRDKIVFEGMTDEQFDLMFSFIEKYSSHLDNEIKNQDLC